MIPEDRFSSVTHKGDLLNPWSRQANLSRHWGPIALQDPSAGLLVKIWQVRALQDGMDLLLSSSGVDEYVWYTHTKAIEEVSLAFDQNGLGVVAFVDVDGGAFLRWFDPTVNAYVTEDITNYATTPRVTLDDARQFNLSNSDVILGYVRAGVIRYRRQRDRFQDEYTPPVGPGGSPASATALRHISMNSNLRLEFLTNEAGAEPWTLAEIILDLVHRVGIGAEKIDVRDLYGIIVNGYKVASEQTPADIITQLQGIYPFDVCEYDGRIHFPLRGHDPVTTITIDDMVERDGDPLTITDVQEIELLRKLQFNYCDMSNGYGTNSATAERRAATVNAESETNTEAPISMYPSEAKDVVEAALNLQWAERNKYEFHLSQRHNYLTPGDDVLVVDSRGDTHRVRLTSILDREGRRECEGITSAPWALESKFTASQSPGGTPGDNASVSTEADFIVMNLPSWDGSDELGFYIAAHDTPDVGCDIQIIADGMALTDVGELNDKATVGFLTAPLLPEIGPEYLSNQPITIALAGDAEGLTQLEYGELLQYAHMAALEHTDGSWEVLQFEDGTLNPDGTYTLSNVIRGRLNTSPDASDAGCRLVLLDDAVVFAQVAEWQKDYPLKVRAIARDSAKDDAWGWVTPTLTPWAVQTEWPPASVSAVRDGSNTVVVTWVPRPRMNIETAPLQSQYFAGYRVTWSDATVVDVGVDVTTITRSAVPAGATVSVAALNSITGVGPTSESVPT